MADIRIRDAGNVLRTPSRIRIRDAGNVLRLVQQIRIRDAGNVLRVVFKYFSISGSPASLTASRVGAGIVTSGVCTITATGLGPFTYFWARTTVPTTPAITATSPSANASAFTTTFTGINEVVSTFRCTVTDTSTGAILTFDVTVDLTAN